MVRQISRSCICCLQKNELNKTKFEILLVVSSWLHKPIASFLLLNSDDCMAPPFLGIFIFPESLENLRCMSRALYLVNWKEFG